MSQRLSGKSAVVTGGGGGIGRELCLALAAEGAKVVVSDVGHDAAGKSTADKVVEEIAKAGGTAVASYDSIATMQGGENVIKAAISNFGRIDILVNCAAIMFNRGIEEITEQEFDSLLNVQIKGSFSTIKAAIPQMKKQQWGRIINFSSRAAAFGSPNIAYSTGKAAMIGFTVNLAAELKRYGITVNAIVPSALTPTFSSPPGALLALFGPGDSMPVSPNRGPEYIAPIVAYLATDEARDITCQFFFASGGDICIYARPFKVPGPHQFIRKDGKWTIEDLHRVIPPLLK